MFFAGFLAGFVVAAGLAVLALYAMDQLTHGGIFR